jgi:hypothetical protein
MQRIQRTDAALDKADSSSMKVIAVMTMLFLPATFFATVLALSSLNNNNSNNGGGLNDFQPQQPSFQVYLYFSVPATAIVFLAWAVLTKQFSKKKHVLRWIIRRPRYL